MWTGEIIFSEGDLSNPDEYLRVLSEFSYPDCDLRSRQDHVQAMIKRLQAENELLNDLIDKEFQDSQASRAAWEKIHNKQYQSQDEFNELFTIAMGSSFGRHGF